MPLVLAIEPDLRQAAVLKRVVRETTGADVTVVDSRDAAVDAIARAMPDVLLLSALLSPRDEDDMVQHLRTLSGAEHLQTHTIPQLASSLEGPDEGSGAVRGLFKAFRRKKAAQAVTGCDPYAFAEQVRTFIEQAAHERDERAQRDAYLENAVAAANEAAAPDPAPPAMAADAPPVYEEVAAAYEDPAPAYQYDTAASAGNPHWPEDTTHRAELSTVEEPATDAVPTDELVIAQPLESATEAIAAAEPLVAEPLPRDVGVTPPTGLPRSLLSYAGDAAADPGFAEPDREYERQAQAETSLPLIAHEETDAYAYVDESAAQVRPPETATSEPQPMLATDEPEPVLAASEPAVTHVEPVVVPQEPVVEDVEPVLAAAEPVVADVDVDFTAAEPVLDEVEPVLAADEAVVDAPAEIATGGVAHAPAAVIRDSLGPLATWVRFDRIAATPAARTTSDELRALMERLSLPLPVASVTYARGCRIRRVRVQGQRSRKPTERVGPVILSRKELDPALRAGGL